MGRPEDVHTTKRLSRGAGCSEQEYLHILDEVQCGGRFLIFSLGYDSALYLRWAHSESEFVFVENKPEWIEKVCPWIEQYKDKYQIIKVDYVTTVGQFKEHLAEPDKLLMPELSGLQEFDFIFVDGPQGYRKDKPGRMQSIYMASRAIAPGGRVMVHDIDRVAERASCNKFLAPKSNYRIELDDSWIFGMGKK